MFGILISIREFGGNSVLTFSRQTTNAIPMMKQTSKMKAVLLNAITVRVEVGVDWRTSSGE